MRKKDSAKISWDDNGQPKSLIFDDVYFSTESGYDESRYVFIEANKLVDRWEQHPKKCFNIGETGFGTGLNFLVAWQSWRSAKKHHNNQLHFFSVEKYPLSRADLQRSLRLWPILKEQSNLLIRSYPPQPSSGLHRMVFDNGNVILSIYFGEASDGLEQVAPITHTGSTVNSVNCSYGNCAPKIDAWFLDGFAPSKNPDMWNTRLFNAIENLSDTGTTFSTFTAATIVRKNLTRIGFNCDKIKGYGRKREMLVGHMIKSTILKNAILDPTTQHFRHYESIKIKREPSWHLTKTGSGTPTKHCAVIGGGLAGCHTAYALAKKNIDVTLLERHPQIAQEASGNRQAVVYAKLSRYSDPLSRFNFASLLYANNFYRDNEYYTNVGNQCGVLHMGISQKHIQHYQELSDSFCNEPEFIQWLSAADAGAIAGITLKHGALYLPQAGWLSPVQLCQQLIAHPKIKISSNKQVQKLEFTNGCWSLLDQHNEEILQADTVIVANAHDATHFNQCKHLPLKVIRGQVSHAASSSDSKNLQSVICGEGYIAPAFKGIHTLGATFTLNNSDMELSNEEHKKNLDSVHKLSPDFLGLVINKQKAGRVGLRCTTPDYLPLVGPIAKYEDMTESFQFLSKKANAIIDSPGAYHPNLYCNVGHGSRGLCYTPLCSELLASIVAGQFSPIERELYRYLHPARFIIRDLMRNKI